MPARKRADETGEERSITKVALLPAANVAMNAWCDRSGSSKTKAVSRLIEYFALAPDSVKQSLVGIVPEDMQAVYIRIATEHFSEYITKVMKERAAEASGLSLDPAQLRQAQEDIRAVKAGEEAGKTKKKTHPPSRAAG